MNKTSNSTAMADYFCEGNCDSLNDSSYSTYYDYGDGSDFCGGDKRQEEIFNIFQTCFFCVIFLLGVLGNCLVIATFALYRRFRLRSMTDIFLFALAVADLLLLLTLPLQGVDTHLGWIFSVPLCKTMRACYAINTYSGLLLLACISVDRYMVVARAQEMLRLRSQILTGGKLAAVGVWLVAVLLSLPEILYSGVTLNEADNKSYCGMTKSGQVKMATNGANITVFCLSLFIMVVCYTSIACVLWKGRVHRRGKQWRHQRTLKLMVALVLVFLAFQLPYTVVLSRRIAFQSCDFLIAYITCTLAYTRCCLNPILYALVGVRFRKDVMTLIHHWGCPCGIRVVLPTESSVSISASSPALTMLSACSPTSPEGSYSSSDTATPVKFQFPGKQKD
ncbi:C-C chemokine receptor type 10 [Mugil cephalus]|uniref:C-C chemokine receptor type 10 n=1 Tax=Mugil cephalus TaxID=48193 RepID=UPI001FB6EA6A|nr:C-C chemokine receptor type 10 [Mugil cephalus]